MNRKDTKRTETILVKNSPDEKKKIEAFAKELGMGTSTYMRDRALKGKAANRYANRKASAGIVRTSTAIYSAYNMLAETEQETFTKSEVISFLEPIRKEVDAIWH